MSKSEWIERFIAAFVDLGWHASPDDLELYAASTWVHLGHQPPEAAAKSEFDFMFSGD
jgi:hypothetical protein